MFHFRISGAGCLLGLLLTVARPAAAAPAAPAGFAERFDSLAGFLNREELSGFETAQATLLATQVLSTGTQAMPYVQARFIAARSQGDAGLGGTFLVCHGGEKERQLIRRHTETDQTKRKLVWNYVATEERFFGAVEQGAQWQTATTLLPSAAKCRLLAMLCLESRDLLTRRAGMYWGYWVADAPYWRKVRDVSQGDPDPLTRKIAARLMSVRVAQGK